VLIIFVELIFVIVLNVTREFIIVDEWLYNVIYF